MDQFEKYILKLLESSKRAITAFGRSFDNFLKPIFGVKKSSEGESLEGDSKGVVLKKRIISGVVILLLYVVLVLFSLSIFSIVMLFLACIGMEEMNNLARNINDDYKRKSFQKKSILYVFLTFASLIVIRSANGGAFLILWLFLVVSTVDSISYFFGKNFGKIKILPTISPNKTLEGTIAGQLAGIIVSLLIRSVFNDDKSNIISLIFFVVISFSVVVLSQFGDAVQSYIKRSFDVKDTGNLIPGHGGIMDRFDSYTIAAPFFAIVILIFGNII